MKREIKRQEKIQRQQANPTFRQKRVIKRQEKLLKKRLQEIVVVEE